MMRLYYTHDRQIQEITATLYVGPSKRLILLGYGHAISKKISGFFGIWYAFLHVRRKNKRLNFLQFLRKCDPRGH